MLNRQQGFSLLEMAIIVLVIGLLMGSVMMPLSVSVEQRRMSATKEQLTAIKEQLLGYAVIYGNLPCPAQFYEFDGTNDAEVGLPDSSLCTEEGYLPWRELGIGRYDAWGRPFRYRVDNVDYTASIENFSGTSSENRLRIRTIRYASDTSDDFTWLTVKSDDTRVAAVIFSCGMNGRPDPTAPSAGDTSPKVTLDYTYSNDADDARNTQQSCTNPNAGSWNATDVYIQNEYIENGFDDILTWVSRNRLMNRLIAAGQLPPDY